MTQIKAVAHGAAPKQGGVAYVAHVAGALYGPLAARLFGSARREDADLGRS